MSKINVRDTIRLPVNFSSRLQHATFQTSIHNRYPRVVSTMFLHPQHLNTSHIARQFRPSRRQISSGCAHPFDRVVRPGESVGPKIEKRQSSVCSLSLSLAPRCSPIYFRSVLFRDSARLRILPRRLARYKLKRNEGRGVGGRV